VGGAYAYKRARTNLAKNILTYSFLVICRGCNVAYWRALDWMIGFIDHLYTALEKPGNYSAIADLHSLKFTVTNAQGS
jgi:hypothetical protein